MPKGLPLDFFGRACSIVLIKPYKGLVPAYYHFALSQYILRKGNEAIKAKKRGVSSEPPYMVVKFSRREKTAGIGSYPTSGEN